MNIKPTDTLGLRPGPQLDNHAERRQGLACNYKRLETHDGS